MEQNYNSNLNEENFLPGMGKENPFHVPKDYFETLSDRIKSKVECEEELKEFTALNRISKNSGFKTPENYFASAENILEYQFELSGLKNLSAIKKTNLQVEPDYFESIADRVKEKYHAQPRKQTVVVQIWNLVANPKLAIAASIILVAGISAIWYANQTTTVINTSDCKTLACLEKNELLKEMGEFDEDNLYDLVDVESLGKQLSSDSTTVTNQVLDSTVQKNEE